jgi:hypothetical protein
MSSTIGRCAEANWKAARWVRSGGRLLKHDGFRQLPRIKSKVSTDKVLQIEPEEDLKKRTGQSPDYVEASLLTLALQAPEPRIR